MTVLLVILHLDSIRGLREIIVIACGAGIVDPSSALASLLVWSDDASGHESRAVVGLAGQPQVPADLLVLGDWRLTTLAREPGDARAQCPSVDRAKPAICRHFETGHFRLAAETD
jgi:hypothetical protein